MNINNGLRSKNIGAGWLYFYIHFATEVLCFYFLSLISGDSPFLWAAPFLYDCLAFVPQGLIGAFSDKYPKVNLSIIGSVLMALGGILFVFNPGIGRYTPIVIICLGNACTHVQGAEITLRASGGKLAHSAIFVSGGSFGVITGKLLANVVPFYTVVALVLTIIPFALLADNYRTEYEKIDTPCKKFKYNNPKFSAATIIIIATLIVIVRGYMGYGIPTSWKKTTLENVLLFVTMGIGKAAGGILSDSFGMKKIALISVAGALPFLFFGDNIMLISLIGVMMFSMTMSITLALIVSVLPKSPGLGFGFTTLGLFLGTAPIFFFKFTTTLSNCIIITVLSALCLVALALIIKSDKETFIKDKEIKNV